MSDELSEGAVAVISSIAGFVLGGVPKETSEQKSIGDLPGQHAMSRHNLCNAPS
jgi:hypothetical protein